MLSPFCSYFCPYWLPVVLWTLWLVHRRTACAGGLVFWVGFGVGLWVFLQVSALVFSGQMQVGMVGHGPLTSTALSKLVLMQISDLVLLCKFTKLLWEHLVLISWHSLHGSICDQGWYILQGWQITTSQHLSLQEAFEQNLPWNGPKNTALFSTNKYLPHGHDCALWVFLLTLCPFFMKQSTADKEGRQGLLHRHRNHV